MYGVSRQVNGLLALVPAVVTLLAYAGMDARRRAQLVVVPIAFTGEHVETLQELDIIYREHAAARGITHFARARTVGTHPAFIDALATLAREAAAARGWL